MKRGEDKKRDKKGKKWGKRRWFAVMFPLATQILHLPSKFLNVGLHKIWTPHRVLQHRLHNWLRQPMALLQDRCNASGWPYITKRFLGLRVSIMRTVWAEGEEPRSIKSLANYRKWNQRRIKECHSLCLSHKQRRIDLTIIKHWSGENEKGDRIYDNLGVEWWCP